MSENSRPILKGARVLLRAPRPEDRSDRLAAGRDPEFRRMVGGTGPDPGPLTAAEVERWYAGLVAETYSWVVEFEGHCIGVARLQQVDLAARNAQYAIGLFRPEHRGRGFGQEVTRLVLDHAFGPLGLERVALRVLDFNERAIACYRRCGFVEVARETVYLADVPATDVVMEIRARPDGDSEERPPIIETARLSLVVLLPNEIDALIAGDTRRAGELVGVTFPDGWPQEEAPRSGLPWHLKHLRADVRQRAWRIRVIVERETGVVVGSVNMKGPPDEGGDVEIGWGVSEDRRRRGYAFEATAAVIGWAARQPGVESVSATIPETNLVSQRLARKLGMTMTSQSRGDLPLWRRPAAPLWRAFA